jgi:hypothetical protein
MGSGAVWNSLVVGETIIIECVTDGMDCPTNVANLVSVTAEVDPLVADEVICVEKLTTSCRASVTCDCRTRTKNYWFNRPGIDEKIGRRSGRYVRFPRGRRLPPVQSDTCATLYQAFLRIGAPIDLGWIQLGTTDVNNDGVVDEKDAVNEALGLFWGNRGFPADGWLFGDERILCHKRKLFSLQYIAALANNRLFGAVPERCLSLQNGETFPPDMFETAKAVAKCDDPDLIMCWEEILDQFNESSSANELPEPWETCAADFGASQKAVDPSTVENCPAIDDCDPLPPEASICVDYWWIPANP